MAEEVEEEDKRICSDEKVGNEKGKRTDKEVFNDLSIEKKVKTNGRPRFNRELGYELIRAGYSTRRIKKILGCSARTVRLMKQEMRENGATIELNGEAIIRLDKSDLKFDDEAVRAVGISFYDWAKSQTVAYEQIFNFCKKT